MNSKWLIRDLKLDCLLSVVKEEPKKIEEIAKKRLIEGLPNPAAISQFQKTLQIQMAEKEKTRRIFELASETIEKVKPYKNTLSPQFLGSLTMTMKLNTYLKIAILTGEGLNQIEQIQTNMISEKRKVQLQELRMLLGEEETRSFLLAGGLGEGFHISEPELIQMERVEKRNREKKSESTFWLWKKKAEAGKNSGMESIKGSENLQGEIRQLEESVSYSLLRIVSAYEKKLEEELVHIQETSGFAIFAEKLFQRLKQAGVPVCFPEIMDYAEKESTSEVTRINKLMELSVVLKNEQARGNTLDLTGKETILITGANQGGKTTFLRSIGQAQLMAQCGLFVVANSYQSPFVSGIFTHFPDEEEAGAQSGLLDLECRKFQEIMREIEPGGLLLMNESFLTTTEYLGADFSAQAVSQCKNREVRLIFVTHNYLFASRMKEKKDPKILFLKAVVREDESRTYEIREGAPERSAYAMKLYREIIEGTPGNQKS